MQEQDDAPADSVPLEENTSTDSPLLQSTIKDWSELDPEFVTLAVSSRHTFRLLDGFLEVYSDSPIYDAVEFIF